ncbi:MAG: hypothetical protein EXR86_16255 [Gammaproteobacteria bacterium]|nr:hypothetical protein [Gammaproteobacteria bacterium]
MNSERPALRQSSMPARVITAVFAFGILGGGNAAMAGDVDVAPPGRSIGYAFSEIIWGVYETKDAKEECPQGVVALGPREEYKLQFPDDGTKRKVVDTQMVREADVWWPKAEPNQFPFREAGGKIGIGLDLDGKVKPTDFTSPEGRPGIDNQLFRAIGCVMNYRSPGSILNIEKTFFKNVAYDRLMIELTDVDSLVNDGDVTITTYRGLDTMPNDATGNNLQPGGTQRLDLIYGKSLIRKVKAKIVNGVLISEHVDLSLPRAGSTTLEWMRDARFEVKLAPEKAEGIIGGYADIESIYNARNRRWPIHHLAYGQEAPGSVYRALRKLADGFPDPKTGEYTAISAALTVKLVQVRVLHHEKEISMGNAVTQFSDTRAAQPAK